MQELITFETNQHREVFIAEKQNKALDLIKFHAINRGTQPIMEHEIALLSIIAVKPQFIDEQNLQHLASLDINLLPLIGQAHLLKEPQIMNASAPLSIYAIIHEFFHQISFKIAKRDNLNKLERVLEEGVVDNCTIDVVSSEQFEAICQKYNYEPILSSSGYVVERAITGLLDLCLNGEVERAHVMGTEKLNALLIENSVDGQAKGEYLARLADSLLGIPERRQPLADRYARINEMMSVVLLDEASELLGRQWNKEDFMRLVRYRRDFFEAMKLNIDSAHNLDLNATNDMIEQFKACENIFDTMAYRYGYSVFDEMVDGILAGKPLQSVKRM
ncbi:MAG: hypothetical protein IJ301_01365 [Clostridia bacterium]|nr:hypothetical protein [Clostridia bacterium]